MAIRQPVESAARARAYSVNAGTVLTASLLAGGGLNTAEHRRQVQGAATAAREVREHEEEGLWLPHEFFDYSIETCSVETLVVP